MDVLQTQINNLQNLIIKLNNINSSYSDRINELNIKIQTVTDKTLREEYYELISKYKNVITTNNNKIREIEAQIGELRAEKARQIKDSIDVSPEVAPNVTSKEKEDDIEGKEEGRREEEARREEEVRREEEARREEEVRREEEAKKDAEIAAEDAENAEFLAAEKKIRKDAVNKMITEEIELKKKKKKSLKKKLGKPYKIKASHEYSRKITKEQAKKNAIGKRFRTTLTQKKKIDKHIIQNSNIICKAILKSGKNITRKKYYLPSEFPNLTKLKPIVNQKEGEK